MERIEGISGLTDRFDVFLLDQYGVLHDGTLLYPGVVEALEYLQQCGKTVMIISNSGRRAAANMERLSGIGIAPDLYQHLVTSGEVAWQMLAARGNTALGDTGNEMPASDLSGARTCFLVTRGDGPSVIEGLDLAETDDAEAADLVLIAGSEGDRHPIEHYRSLLAPAARRATPCLCTNPDKIMLTPTGPAYGAGRIAELYQELGGPVRWIGKPFPEIYRNAMRMLVDPDTARCIVVGDSIEHDIAGGKAAGLAAALVRTGVLADQTDDQLNMLFAEHGAQADFQLGAFRR